MLGHFLHSLQSCRQEAGVSVAVTAQWGLTHVSVPSPVMVTAERQPRVLSKPQCAFQVKKLAEERALQRGGFLRHLDWHQGFGACTPAVSSALPAACRGCRACAAPLLAGNIHSARREKQWHIRTAWTDAGRNT